MWYNFITEEVAIGGRRSAISGRLRPAYPPPPELLAAMRAAAAATTPDALPLLAAALAVTGSVAPGPRLCDAASCGARCARCVAHGANRSRVSQGTRSAIRRRFGDSRVVRAPLRSHALRRRTQTQAWARHTEGLTGLVLGAARAAPFVCGLDVTLRNAFGFRNPFIEAEPGQLSDRDSGQ